MIEQEVQDLRIRCVYAQSHGFALANIEDFVSELVSMGAADPGDKPISPATLIEMIDNLVAKPAMASAIKASRPVAKAKATSKAPPPPQVISPSVDTPVVMAAAETSPPVPPPVSDEVKKEASSSPPTEVKKEASSPPPTEVKKEGAPSSNSGPQS